MRAGLDPGRAPEALRFGFADLSQRDPRRAALLLLVSAPEASASMQRREALAFDPDWR